MSHKLLLSNTACNALSLLLSHWDGDIPCGGGMTKLNDKFQLLVNHSTCGEYWIDTDSGEDLILVCDQETDKKYKVTYEIDFNATEAKVLASILFHVRLGDTNKYTKAISKLAVQMEKLGLFEEVYDVSVILENDEALYIHLS